MMTLPAISIIFCSDPTTSVLLLLKPASEMLPMPMISTSARIRLSICSHNGPSITRMRGSRYPPVRVSSMFRLASSVSAMGRELVTMCSDLFANSPATAATVEPPSRITV